MEIRPKYLVLYDGDCGFCNRSVAYILKRERHHEIHFSALHSRYTQDLFDKEGWPQPDLNTFYFIQDDIKLERSAAAFEMFKHLKAPTSWLRIFRFLPRMFNDWCYNFVAKRRNRISKGFCVVPSQDERLRFIK